ncbi:MAG: hypothetical protein Q8861_08670 [Bacteroidota bacterium]|nr:hypothetical protein [Bacteroidota bacterium]
MKPQSDNFECCPPFDPTPWDDKLFQWEKKRFVKDRVLTLFYYPVNFGKRITRLIHLIEDSDGKMEDWMCLSDHTSKWNMNIYAAVDKEIFMASNVEISGTFYSRVYEGHFRETDKWCADFTQHIKEKGMELEKMYMWYTTCPKCAKKYGKNYVVIIAKVRQ